MPRPYLRPFMEWDARHNKIHTLDHGINAL